MNPIRSIALIVCVAAGSVGPSLSGQSTSPPPPVAAPNASPVPAARRLSQAHPAERPPASTLPQGLNRMSTPQRAALGNPTPPIRELPSFTVQDRDGKPMATASLTHPSHWVLLYRRDECLPCDRLMNVISAAQFAATTKGKPYVILVAGKKADGLERVRANFGNLSDATWLSDKNDQILAALKPHGSPMLYGMDGSKIIWSVAGTLGNPAMVEKMTSAWLQAIPVAPKAEAVAAPASGK